MKQNFLRIMRYSSDKSYLFIKIQNKKIILQYNHLQLEEMKNQYAISNTNKRQILYLIFSIVLL